MKFLAKKFAYLSAQCELLGRPKSDKISDRKLGRLIDQYTTVESEVLYQNNFFKAFLGTNVICYFGAAVLVGRQFLLSKFKFVRNHFKTPTN